MAEARLKFLEAAAVRYALETPQTSAHLMRERRSLIDDLEKPLKEKTPISECKACGSILIPGWNKRARQALKKSQKSVALPGQESIWTSKQGSPLDGSQVALDCPACFRSTRILVRQPPHTKASRAQGQHRSSSRAAPSTSGKELSSAQGPGVSQATASSNATSKKRAKARKQSGLQVMLEKARGPIDQSSGLGLELMDLMADG